MKKSLQQTNDWNIYKYELTNEDSTNLRKHILSFLGENINLEGLLLFDNDVNIFTVDGFQFKIWAYDKVEKQ